MILFEDFRCHEVTKDENSLFRCLSLALTGTQNHFNELRQTMANYTSYHQKDFCAIDFDVGGFMICGNDYIKKIKNFNFFPNDLEIASASYLYNLVINVYMRKHVLKLTDIFQIHLRISHTEGPWVSTLLRPEWTSIPCCPYR